MANFGNKGERSEAQVMDLASVLTTFNLFKGMTLDQVKHAAKVLRIESYPAGTDIWQEGDTGSEILLLLKGTVDITQTLTLFTSDEGVESRDKSLISLTEGMRPVIGEIAMCANVPRSATVTAKTDIQVGIFSPEDLETIIKNDAAFGMHLFRNIATVLAQRLVTANQNVLKLTTAFSLALQRGG